jgi:hypothetical protein
MNESNVNDGPHGEPPSESPDKVPVLVPKCAKQFLVIPDVDRVDDSHDGFVMTRAKAADA